nr:hypothetical protein Q903MT_gene4595 [Picea sitchensis]
MRCSGGSVQCVEQNAMDARAGVTSVTGDTGAGRREMTRFNLVGDRFAGKKRVSALRTAMVLSMQNVVGAFPRK